MEERVLVLVPSTHLAEKYLDGLRRYGVEVIGVCFDLHKIPFGSLAEKFNIIVIDTLFCHNSRDTAALVRKIRREFYDPIFAVEHCMTTEGILPLQVAGCNFIIRPDSDEFTNRIKDEDYRIIRKVCFTLSDIGDELTRPHHRAAA